MDLCDFKARLIYTVSSRAAKTTLSQRERKEFFTYMDVCCLYVHRCLLSLYTLDVYVWEIPPPRSISLLHSLFPSPGFDGLPFAGASFRSLCSGSSLEIPCLCQCLDVFPFFSKCQFQVFNPLWVDFCAESKGSNFSLGEGIHPPTPDLQIMSFLLSNKTKHLFAVLSSVGAHDTQKTLTQAICTGKLASYMSWRPALGEGAAAEQPAVPSLLFVCGKARA